MNRMLHKKMQRQKSLSNHYSGIEAYVVSQNEWGKSAGTNVVMNWHLRYVFRGPTETQCVTRNFGK
jgi:hypothetical protein